MKRELVTGSMAYWGCNKLTFTLKKIVTLSMLNCFPMGRDTNMSFGEEVCRSVKGLFPAFFIEIFLGVLGH